MGRLASKEAGHMQAAFEGADGGENFRRLHWCLICHKFASFSQESKHEFRYLDRGWEIVMDFNWVGAFAQPMKLFTSQFCHAELRKVYFGSARILPPAMPRPDQFFDRRLPFPRPLPLPFPFLDFELLLVLFDRKLTRDMRELAREDERDRRCERACEPGRELRRDCRLRLLRIDFGVERDRERLRDGVLKLLFRLLFFVLVLLRMDR